MENGIVLLIIGLVCGAAIGYLLARSLSRPMQTGDGNFNVKEWESRVARIEQEKNHLLGEKMKLEGSVEKSREVFSEQHSKLSKAETENKELTARLATAEAQAQQLALRLKETKAEIEQLQEKFSKEFELAASRILEEKTKKFTEQNKENMQQVIDPFREKIKEFEKKVEETYVKGTQERSTLAEQIKSLTELNQQMRLDAKNLTTALKGDSKQQGNWGELILDKILERSGLEKGREYEVQYSTTGDDGKKIQPDVVIHLPDRKHIIVDSKVSLTAYNEWINEPDETMKAAHLKNHLVSLRNHIRQLSEKNYHLGTGLNSPEFVLMFIPLESSFSAAIQQDIELWSFAWDKKVVLVSPSTLLATLRTIASVWKQEKQNQNTLEIAKQAGALYDKFVGFLQDMEKIEKGILAVQNSYHDARNKLSDGKDNLVRKVERIRELGAKTSKDIPESFNTQE